MLTTAQQQTRTPFVGTFASENTSPASDLQATSTPSHTSSNSTPATASKPRGSFLSALLRALSSFAA